MQSISKYLTTPMNLNIRPHISFHSFNRINQGPLSKRPWSQIQRLSTVIPQELFHAISNIGINLEADGALENRLHRPGHT